MLQGGSYCLSDPKCIAMHVDNGTAACRVLHRYARGWGNVHARSSHNRCMQERATTT